MTDEQLNETSTAWQQASGVYSETLKAMQARLMEAAGAMAGLAANAAASARAGRGPGGAAGERGGEDEGHPEAYATDLLAARIEALAARVERIEQLLSELMQPNGAGKRAKKKAKREG